MGVSLRSHLEKLLKSGQLARIKKQVSAEFELGALLNKTKGTLPTFFDDVKGYQMPVVGGLCGDRDLIGGFLGADKKELIPAILAAMSNPLPSRLVPAGPCQEHVITNNIDLLKLLPIPKFHEKDAGHFITGGIILVRDPVLGRYFTSIRRMQFQSGNKLSVLIESPGLLEMYYQKEKQNQPLEFVILIGVHPVLTLTSQLNTQLYGLDKLGVAGALLGESVEMVKAKTVDLEVPAQTEIVLEGRMLPHKRMTEGPFGELAGYYGPASDQPYAEITAVTHRSNPIFQAIFPSSYEHKLPNAIMREVTLYLHVRHLVPSVKEVHVTMAGSGRFHAVISIAKRYEGEGKSAIMAALAANKDYKHVVVVNDDVDIWDPYDVEWAIATRVQADEDVVIIPPARGCSLEPSNNIRGVSAKMGIDATYPLAYANQFERVRIPGYDAINLEDYLEA